MLFCNFKPLTYCMEIRLIVFSIHPIKKLTIYNKENGDSNKNINIIKLAGIIKAKSNSTYLNNVVTMVFFLIARK